MKKKFFSMIIIFIMLVGIIFTFAGCGTTKDKDDTISNNAKTNDSSNVIENNKKENNTSNTTTASKRDYYDWRGKKLYYPEGYKREIVNSSTLWKGTGKSGEKISFLTAQSMSYEWSENPDVNKVSEILDKDISDSVKEYYPSYDSTYTNTIDKKQNISINGTTFIKVSGTITTKIDENYPNYKVISTSANHKTSANLKYVVYYGILDFPDYKKSNIPIAIMCFSEAENNDTIEEIDELVTYAVENLK